MRRVQDREQAEVEFRAKLHGAELHTGRGGGPGGGGDLRRRHEAMKSRLRGRR